MKVLKSLSRISNVISRLFGSLTKSLSEIKINANLFEGLFKIKLLGRMFPVFNSSLKTQLISVLVAVSLIPMILVGFITYRMTITNLDTEKGNTLKAYAEGISGNIEAQIESAANLIKGISSNSDIMVVMEEINSGVAEEYSPRRNAIEFSLKNVIDGSGKLYETVQISDINGKVTIDGSKYRSEYVGKQFYDMSDFDLLKNGNEVIVGNPFISQATGNLILPVSRPIKSLSGFMGVMTVMYDLNKFTANFDHIKPGESGEVIVLNSKNMIVYHTNKDLINKENSNQSLLDTLNKKDSKSDKLFYKSEKNEKVSFYNRSTLTSWLIIAQIDMEEFAGPVTTFTRFLVILIVVMVIIAILISVIYSGYITKPIVSLMKLMKQVELGYLNVTADFNETVNEIAQLKKSFTDMTSNLKNLINNVINASSQINNTTGKMALVSHNSIAHAEQTLTAVTDITASIQEQASDTEVVTHNIEKLADMIFTAKGYSDEINKYSSKAYFSSEKGLKLVDILKEKSEENKRNTELVESVISLLNEEIVEINKIAKTITNIAKQTNLLSLNASIEAARAGDAGKGFAVVASEIKNLSDQTRNEAEEINKLIINIQNKALELVDTMRSATHSAGEQNAAVADTGEAFDEIFKSIKDINGKVVNIKEFLDEMNNEKANIVNLMREINRISEEVAATSENVQQYTDNQINIIKEVHNYSDELNNLANNLNKSVEMFKL